MELYKSLAEKCKIEENSRVHVPDEALRFFVRLTIADPSKESFATSGYTAGLFNGTGDISYESVKQYHEEISKEVLKLKAENKMYGIHEHFGVELKYTQKEDYVPKSKIKP